MIIDGIAYELAQGCFDSFIGAYDALSLIVAVEYWDVVQGLHKAAYGAFTATDAACDSPSCGVLGRSLFHYFTRMTKYLLTLQKACVLVICSVFSLLASISHVYEPAGWVVKSSASRA